MRIVCFILMIFLSLKIQAQLKDKIEIKQIGLINKDGYYLIFDPCGKLDVSIKKCKRLLFSNIYLITGRIVSDPFFEDCKTKYCKDAEYKIPIVLYKGTNDEINRKITFLKRLRIDCCGRFKICNKLKKGENIYIYLYGYSLVEIRIKPS